MTEEIKTEGICLRAVEYGESDRIITLLTDKVGKVAVRARGVSSPKSKLRHAALPFSFGEYILSVKNDYYSLKSFDYNDAFTSVSDELVRYFSGTAGLEIADKLTEESVPVREEMARLLRFLMTITYDRGGVEALLTYLLDMLRIAGYAVSRDGIGAGCDPKDYCFDLEEGGFLPLSLKSPYAVKMSAAAIRTLVSYLDGREESLADRFVASEIFSCLSQYVRVKTGKQLRSLFELCDLFRNGL